MNKRNKIEVSISPQLSIYIQRINYEFEGMKSLLTTIISSQNYVYTTDLYERYKNEYLNKHNELKLIMAELIEEYFPSEWSDDRDKVIMHVDFVKECLVFTLNKEGCKTCS
jgi:hypothetical protein